VQLTNGLTCATPATARAGLDTVLLEVGPVCVAWPGVHVHSLVSIVLGALVLVHDLNADRCAQCDAKLGAGLDLDLVLLISRSCDRGLSGTPARHLGLNVGFGELHTRRAAVDDGADAEAVRLAIAEEISELEQVASIATDVRGDPEVLAEGRHVCGVLGFLFSSL
jgi:hypothetical protein